MGILSRLGFVKEVANVEARKGMDALTDMLVRFDPIGASEAEIAQIEKTLNEFCQKTEEARQHMLKLEEQAKSAHESYDKKMLLAQNWQAELEKQDTPQERRGKIEESLSKLVGDLEDEAPVITQRDEEVKIARETFETFSQIVNETNEKLRTRIKDKEKAVANLELAKAQEQLAKDKLTAAKIQAGMRQSANDFNVSEAIGHQTDNAKIRTDATLHEIELLNSHKTEDDFVADELKKLDGKNTNQPSIKDRLSALKK